MRRLIGAGVLAMVPAGGIAGAEERMERNVAFGMHSGIALPMDVEDRRERPPRPPRGRRGWRSGCRRLRR